MNSAVRQRLLDGFADTLAVATPTVAREALEAVAKFNGDLEPISYYGELRMKGEAHSRALLQTVKHFQNIRVTQHLMACLVEEKSEVTKLLCKAFRFGIHDHHPDRLQTNWEEARREVHDYVAVYQLLANNLGYVDEFDENLIRQKKVKTIQLMGQYGVLK